MVKIIGLQRFSLMPLKANYKVFS